MPRSTVITHAKLNPGGIDQIAEEFRHLQSGLLAGEKAFLGAELCADRTKNTIVLITRWKSNAAWERFRGSAAVDALLKRLEGHFAEEPTSWVCDQLTFVERGEGEATRVALGSGD